MEALARSIHTNLIFVLNPMTQTSKRTTRRPQMGDGDPASGSPPAGGSSSNSHYPFPWSRPTTIPGSTSAVRYPTPGGKLFPGSLSSLPNRPSSALYAGGKGKGKSIDRLLRIKQESGDEDELEDDSDTNGRPGRRNGNGVAGEDGNPPMTLRETLEKLAKLLAESVEHEQAGGDPAGAG